MKSRLSLANIVIVRLCLALTIVIAIDTNAAAIRPSTSYDATPSSLGIPYDSLNITTSARYRLTAWLCHPASKQTDQLVVLAGPDAGNMANELQLVQLICKNLGVDVLLFDYRGFGTSDYTPIDTDLIAKPELADDLNEVLRFVRSDLHIDSSKTIVYGRSLGASLAITVAAKYGGVGGVVAESPYVTQNALKEYYDSVYKEAGSRRRVKTIKSSILEPLTSIQSLACPILIVHGADESQVTSREIDRLFLRCPGKNKCLYIAPRAGHMEVPYKQSGVFLNLLYSFLKAASGG